MVYNMDHAVRRQDTIDVDADGKNLLRSCKVPGRGEVTGDR